MVVLLSQTQQSPEVLYGGFSGRGKHALEELPPLSQTLTEQSITIPHVPSLLIYRSFDHVRIGDCLSDYVLVVGSEVIAPMMTLRGQQLPHGCSLLCRCSGS